MWNEFLTIPKIFEKRKGIGTIKRKKDQEKQKKHRNFSGRNHSAPKLD